MRDDIPTEAIYEAILEDEAFAGLPDILARAGRGRSAVIQWSHADGFVHALAYNYYDADYVAAYADGFAQHDVWLMTAGREVNLNRTISSADHLSLSAFERSVIYNEYTRPHGDDTFITVGSALRSSGGTGLLTVGRGRHAAPFEADDLARVEAISRPLRHVLKVRGELASHRRLTRSNDELLDAVGLCLLVVRNTGAIVQHNAAAERLLSRAGALQAKRGLLVAARPDDANRLARALALATAARAPEGASIALGRGLGPQPLVLSISPLMSGQATALILFHDPVVDLEVRAGRLRNLFGLTGAEADLAVSLAQGLTLAEHAAHRRVMPSTVKSQMKSLAEKTGCRRQAQIVALVSSLPPLGR